MSYIADELKNKVRLEAQSRCGYCLTPQQIVSMLFEIEHIRPVDITKDYGKQRKSD